jgi:hypothetical protein
MQNQRLWKVLNSIFDSKDFEPPPPHFAIYNFNASSMIKLNHNFM